jgi:serine/threonine protein kinase
MIKVTSNSLPIGSILHDKYKILNVLGDGAFGVTYKVKDTSLDRLGAIKEFLPANFSVREVDRYTVCIRSESDKNNYAWGLESFAKEAKALAKFSHKNIVEVRTIFQENNTAYFEMPFEEGQDLAEHLKLLNRKLTETEIINIAIPILNGLKELHKHNLLHRDIKPENIFIRDNGMPMLIDFGAAREAMGSKSQDLTQILTPKYAPPEQYESDRSKQGPWTDIYSFGIVLYRLITNFETKDIPASPDRQCSVYVDHNVDPLKKPKADGYSQKLIDTVWKMIEIRAKDRHQNCNDVIKMLIETSEEKCSQCGTTTSALTNGICKDCNTVDLGKECKKCHKNFKANELDNGICIGCKKEPKSKNGWILGLILGIFLITGTIYFIINYTNANKDTNNTKEIIKNTNPHTNECSEDDHAVGLC